MRKRDYILAPLAVLIMLARWAWAKLTGTHYDPPDFG